MKTIAVLSTVHPHDDTRIYHRQAMSLSQKYKVNIYINAPFQFQQINENLCVWGLPEWKKKSDRAKTIFKLLKYIVNLKADIVIIHDPELLLIVPVIKIFKRIPIVYDIHENYVEMIQEKLWIPIWLRKTLSGMYVFLEKLTFPFIDMVWYPVNNIGNHYQSYKNLRKYQIRNVPAINSFQIENKHHQKKDRIIFLGYLIDDRGIKEIIQAFQKVLIKYPNYELVFVGAFQSDSFEDEITSMVQNFKLTDNIHFLGKVPYEKVAEYLFTAKIGLLNYLPIPNNIHGLPNKLFEYMAAGLPVIASNFDNYREVLEETQAGLLVDPTKPGEIADAIIFLLKDKKKMSQLGQNGQIAIQKKYCWEKETEKLFRAIEKLFN